VSPAQAAPVTEFPVEAGAPLGKHVPQYITAAPDGTLWFTDVGTAKAVRQINTGGEPLAEITSNPPVADIGFGPDGALYWAAAPGGEGGFGRRASNGNVTEYHNHETFEPYAIGFLGGEVRFTAHHEETNPDFAICSQSGCAGLASSRMTDLTQDSSGGLWTLQPEGDSAFHLSSAGAVDLSVALPQGSRPGRGALGPDGNLWIAGFGNAYDSSNTLNRIIRLTPGGVQTSFVLPAGQGPNEIIRGPDGALWFTQFLSNSIGRITTSGQYSVCSLPSAASKPQPYGIAAGSDGALWFTEYAAGKIGRLVPDGSCVATPVTVVEAVPDKTKPGLGALRFSRGTFRAATSGASTSAKRRRRVPVGTKISFSLTEPSVVRFTVDRRAKGRRVRRRCVKPRRSNRSRKRCTRWVRVRGSFTVAGKAGTNTITFRGRIGGRSLKPGRYRLNSQATDASRNRSATRRRAFRIVR
jgi:virginiamycin B lyase